MVGAPNVWQGTVICSLQAQSAIYTIFTFIYNKPTIEVLIITSIKQSHPYYISAQLIQPRQIPVHRALLVGAIYAHLV